MKHVLGFLTWTAIGAVVTVLSFNFFSVNKVAEQVQAVEQNIKAVQQEVIGNEFNETVRNDKIDDRMLAEPEAAPKVDSE